MSRQPRATRRRFLQGTLAATAPLWLPRRGGQLWGAEPTRVGRLKTLSELPLNAEPPLAELTQNWITPTELFFVRSHGPNPQIDLSAFRLSIEGLVERPLTLKLDEVLAKGAQREVTATLCCAGNRRTEHSAIKPVDGVQWGAGALGNAVWSGVRLADLLRQAGLKSEARHIWFEGLDRHDFKGTETLFGASIPIERALSEAAGAEALLATRMNGEPLTVDHGAPLRGIVPGFIGARSVKWLSRIIVSDRPSPNHYVAHAYRVVQEATEEQWQQASIIYELPLQSVVSAVEPPRDTPRGRRVVARGYAAPSGAEGRTIERVEVSSNGGRTWHLAKLDEPSKPYCWRFWQADVPVGERSQSIVVRAFDSAWQTQPERPAWNAKGYMFNSWHSAPIPS